VEKELHLEKRRKNKIARKVRFKHINARLLSFFIISLLAN